MIEDKINHPKHYCSHPSGVECIRITEHMNFNLGNVVKYCWRTDHKNGLEDLNKARWYLEREISRLEAQNQGKAEPKPYAVKPGGITPYPSTEKDKGIWPPNNFDKEV